MFRSFVGGLGALTRWVGSAVKSGFSALKTALTYESVTKTEAPKQLYDIYAESMRAGERLTTYSSLRGSDVIPANYFEDTTMRYSNRYVYQYQVDLVYSDRSVEAGAWKQLSSSRRLTPDELSWLINEQISNEIKYAYVEEYEVTDYHFYHRTTQ